MSPASATAAGGRKRIAVIGGGPAGLTTVKELAEKGFEVTAFDRNPGLGGVFTTAYAGLQLTSSSLITAFGAFVRDRDLERPTLWQCGEYLEYMEEFARHFGLHRHYRFSTTVKSVRRAPGGGWRVRSAAAGEDGAAAVETEEAFDHVVICAGSNVKPVYPEWARPENFDGQILHSGQVHDGSAFAGKRVLIVGMGESGSDMALMAARAGEACAISTRNGPGYVIPRLYRGLPTDMDTNRCYHGLPRSVVNKPVVRFKVKIEDALLLPDADRKVLRKVGEINRVRGVAPFNRFGTKSTAFVEAMIYHGATYHPGVAELRRDGVVFADGTEFPCDTIVCCTGFAPEFAFLNEHAPELARRGCDARSLYKRMFIPEVGTGIAWMGLVRPAVGGVPACAEMQARYLALVLSGEKALPSHAEMHADIQMHAELDHRQFGHDADRLRTMADLFRYMESMAHEIGCRPPLRRLFLRDPLTALKVAFGPLSAAQYRLTGPGAEPVRARSVLRRLPTMPWPVLAYELMLMTGCWAAGLTREPWRKWQRRPAAAPVPAAAAVPAASVPAAAPVPAPVTVSTVAPVAAVAGKRG
ncbi:MAG TPA: FAD-dependent oxidoreductase [Longimicrobium sp.]|nr:FAD-dependent oxidoreductase [Longimicrobium sp.]